MISESSEIQNKQNYPELFQKTEEQENRFKCKKDIGRTSEKSWKIEQSPLGVDEIFFAGAIKKLERYITRCVHWAGIGLDDF